MKTELIRKGSAMNESQIQEWRHRGLRQNRNMLIFTFAVITAGVLAILFSTGTAFPAQSPQTTEQGGWHRGAMRQRSGHELEWLSKKLNLTAEQKAKIKPVLQDEHQQIASIRKDSSLSRQEKMVKFRAVRSKTFAQIRPLLTDAQQNTLHQMQEERQQRMKAWQARHSGNGDSSPQTH